MARGTLSNRRGSPPRLRLLNAAKTALRGPLEAITMRALLVICFLVTSFADPPWASGPQVVRAGERPDATSPRLAPFPFEGARAPLKNVKTLEEWAAVTRDKDPAVRAAAAAAVGEMPFEMKTAVPRLIELLDDENDDVRLGARFRRWATCGPTPRPPPFLLSSCSRTRTRRSGIPPRQHWK